MAFPKPVASQAALAPVTPQLVTGKGPPPADPQRQPPPPSATPPAQTAPVAPACDDDPSTRLGDVIDRSLNYAVSQATLGISPATLAEAYFDWLIHLSAAPGKQVQLWHKALRKAMRLAHYMGQCGLEGGDGHMCIEPLEHDKRAMAQLAVQRDPPGISLAAAVVAQRHDRRTRRHHAA